MADSVFAPVLVATSQRFEIFKILNDLVCIFNSLDVLEGASKCGGGETHINPDSISLWKRDRYILLISIIFAYTKNKPLQNHCTALHLISQLSMSPQPFWTIALSVSHIRIVLIALQEQLIERHRPLQHTLIGTKCELYWNRFYCLYLQTHALPHRTSPTS